MDYGASSVTSNKIILTKQFAAHIKTIIKDKKSQWIKTKDIDIV